MNDKINIPPAKICALPKDNCSTWSYIEIAITFVLPWMPPPTIRTIPNSPKVCAKDIMKEVKNPFLHNGIITFKKVSNGPAPKL